MKVFIEKNGKNINAKARNVRELLDKLKINHTTVIVTRGSEIILDYTKLNEKDNIKVLSVISGG